MLLVDLAVRATLIFLAALVTALVPGGFTQTRIILATTVLCVAMAAVALTRHVLQGAVNATPGPKDP